MGLPSPDRSLLNPAPVTRVLCQIRFDSSPEVSSSATGRAWAEALEGLFPEFGQLQGQVVSIEGGSAQAVPKVNTQTENGWRFSSEANDQAVTLLPGSLALESTSYSGWESFKETCELLLTTLNDTLSPALLQRLGLRYFNELPELEEQADPELLGLHSHPDLSEYARHSEYRTFLEVDGTTAAVRVVIPSDEPAVLDLDVFIDKGRAFSAKAASETLDTLNTNALSVFQACMRDEYLQTLRRGEAHGDA